MVGRRRVALRLPLATPDRVRVDAVGGRVVGDTGLPAEVVDAEPDVIDSNQIGDISDVVDELVERRLPGIADEGREPDRADEAAGRGDGSDLVVGDRPSVIGRSQNSYFGDYPLRSLASYSKPDLPQYLVRRSYLDPLGQFHGCRNPRSEYESG